MCPVCTVTVIAGLGISRLLGIDDLITSLWIGGLILSLSFVTINWIKKSRFKYNSKYIDYLIFGLMYAFVLVPLKLNDSIGIAGNTLWGIDKIVSGIVIGSIVFLAGIFLDKYIRKVRGKQLLLFQKVVFPVVLLALASLIFFFITKR